MNTFKQDYENINKSYIISQCPNTKVILQSWMLLMKNKSIYDLVS